MPLSKHSKGTGRTKPSPSNGTSRESASKSRLDTPSKPPNARAALISPDDIEANDENPRLLFKDHTIESLADSIQKIGLLQPVTVYRRAASTKYTLLDGERRLKASRLINLVKIPAWVIEEPSGVDNTLRMLNIHMLREEWPEISTAWALEKVQEKTGISSVPELSALTGLSPDRVRNMQAVLRFPKPMQQMVYDGELPFNFFVELEKNILRTARKDPKAVLGYTEEQLTNAFFDKYQSNALGDVVELRRVAELIKAGKAEGPGGDRARKALKQLLVDPATRVSEAYEAGAAAAAELKRVQRDLGNLGGRLSEVLLTKLNGHERNALKKSALRLARELESFIEQLG
jgi:ParB family transcriptional regulator, chromosome partitioning protein